MSFLTLNQHAVSVAAGDAQETTEEFALGQGRAFGGTLRDTRRALKRRFELTTTPITRNEAEALKRLVLGDGWHLPFDADLYSETGLQPNTGYTASLGTATPSPKFGAKRLTVPSASTITYAAGLGDGYTVMAWLWDGAAWDHWVRRSDDSTASPTVTLWLNGASGQASLGKITVTSGSVNLKGRNIADSGDEATYVDDLVIFPWVVSDAMIASWSAATAAFSALPKLSLSGDLLREAAALTVRGALGQNRYLQGISGGAWSDALRRVSFTLQEV